MVSTKRVKLEKNSWDRFALDPMVDVKYISDIEPEPFFKLIGDLEGRTLDIGCGVGRLMLNGYCGIDISRAMLDIAKKRKPNCEFKLCDGRKIPYPDDTFENIQCVLVFQHLPIKGVESYLIEASRVLKSGGRFIFQFISSEDVFDGGPLSFAHDTSKIKNILGANKMSVMKISKGDIHPLWTWITAIKK